MSTKTPEEFIHKHFPHVAESEAESELPEAVADLQTDVQYLEWAVKRLTAEIHAKL